MSSDEELEIEPGDGAGPSQPKPKSQKQKGGPSQAPKGKAKGANKKRRTDNGHSNQDHEGPLDFPDEDIRKVHHKISRYKAEAEKRLDENQVDLTSADLDMLVGRVVRFMLFTHYEKPGVPVQRAKLTELITADFKEHPKVRKMPHVVIAAAQERCLAATGLDMREVERATATHKKGDGDGGQKMYVLRSMLPAGVREQVLCDPHRGKGVAAGLMMVVLALIHMEQGSLKEDELFEHLRQLGVIEDQEHPSLGKFKDLMSKMEACRYVMRTKKAGAGLGGQPLYVYEWGECAKEEVGEQGIKAFIDNEFAHQGDKPAAVAAEHRSMQPAEPPIEIVDSE